MGSALSLADAKRIGGRQVPGVMRPRRVLGEEHPDSDAGCLVANPTENAEAKTIPLQTTFKFNGGAPERAPQRAHPP